MNPLDVESSADTSTAIQHRESDDNRRSGSIERRGFLKRGMMVGGAAALVGTYGLDTEIALAQAAPTTVKLQMQLVRRHENDHVATLLSVLGSNARPKPTFQNLRQANLFQFLTVSRALENTGVGAYLGATPAILSRAYLAAAGSIALVEARHAGFLNSLQSRPTTENALGQELTFERALTFGEVGTLAGPFIASLNDGPALSYSDTPSEANDLSILNFALALEYLEAEFYNINVPLFYP